MDGPSEKIKPAEDECEDLEKCQRLIVLTLTKKSAKDVPDK